MTKKQIVRVVAFVLVVCLLLLALCDIFEIADTSYISTRFQTFYTLEEDTLDAVWLGTSGVDRYWIAAKAYEEYGMTVFPLSSDEMASWAMVDLTKEILQKQSPDLLIVDLRVFCQSNGTTDLAETRARRILDAMNPFSMNRLSIAFKTMDVLHQIDSEKPRFDLSYVLSYIKYHTLWSEKDFSLKESISHDECPYMGFFMLESLSLKTKEQSPTVYKTDFYEELNPIAETSLFDFLDYVEQKELNVLFVNTPGIMITKANGRANTIMQILDERDINYINYCQTDSKGTFTLIPDLDYVDDLYNRHHANYYGAEKFTDVFAAYLNENYSFEDHRNEDAVKEDWDGVYEKIKAQINSWENSQSKAEAEK